MTSRYHFREQARQFFRLSSALIVAICGLWLLNFLLGEAPASSRPGFGHAPPEATQPVAAPPPPPAPLLAA